MDLPIYHGWKIYARLGKVTRQETPDLKRKIRSWFDQKGWTYEDNCKTVIYHENINSPIEVVFRYETTEQEKAMGLSNYGIVLKSDFFGLRDNPHRHLCYEVLHKITWKKEAYLLINNEWIRIRKRRILRGKKDGI